MNRKPSVTFGLSCKDYVGFRLTGVLASDPSDASSAP